MEDEQGIRAPNNHIKFELRILLEAEILTTLDTKKILAKNLQGRA